MNGTSGGLLLATFTASLVEFVEALTIVLAMGSTRSWKAALTGAVAAAGSLLVITALVGYSLATWLPESALQLVVGTLLLIFGLQWLRKAILRSSGRKAMHDEAAEFADQSQAARVAPVHQIFGLDAFAFVVSFKGVLLEGLEVVFIVITFGLSADRVGVAAVGAVAAALVVVLLGLVVHRPLTRIPENTLKFGVGLMLTSFGTYWSVSGLGIVSDSAASIKWPGGDWAILVLIAAWWLLSRVMISALRSTDVPGSVQRSAA